MDPSMMILKKSAESEPASMSIWTKELLQKLDQAKQILLVAPDQNGQYQVGDLDLVLNHVGDISSVVKKIRNDLVPVHRLPNELLSKLFLLVSILDHPKSKGPRSIPSLGWIRLVHVCNRWRSGALSDPSLWAQCVFSLPKGFEDRLVLSKEATLSIALNLDEYDLSSLVAPGSSHITRAHIISLQDTYDLRPQNEREAGGFEGTLWSCWRNALSAAHLPHLSNLSVTRYSRNSSGFRWQIEPLIAPHLHETHFVNTFIPFSSPALTRLEINCSDMAGDFCTPNELISILRAASSTLQALILRHWFPNLGVSVLPGPRGAELPILLPHLHELNLAGSAKRCIALRRCFNIPPTVDLRLEINDTQYDNDEDEALGVGIDGEPYYSTGLFPKVVDAFQEHIFRTDSSRPVLCLTIEEDPCEDSNVFLAFKVPRQEYVDKVGDGSSTDGLHTLVQIEFADLN